MSPNAFNAIDVIAVLFAGANAMLIILFIIICVLAVIVFVKLLKILPDLSKALKIYLDKNSDGKS